MTTPNEIKPAAPAEAPAGGRCAVDAGFGGFWRVCHEGHDTDLHGPPPKFATEAEARSACERWNKDIAGHHAYYVPPPPAEFTSSPNGGSEPRDT